MSIDIYKRIDDHLMKDQKPSAFLNHLLSKKLLDRYPFDMLSKLVETEQSPQHHPEGNVWNHTMLVLDKAAQIKDQSREPRVFMWSALLHDLGKAPATRIRNGKITAYDHDKIGAELAKRFLNEFDESPEFIAKVAAMVRWHMQVLFVVKDLPFANMKEMLKQVPLEEIALLSYCDRMGRGELTSEKEMEEEHNIRVFLEKCRQALESIQ